MKLSCDVGVDSVDSDRQPQFDERMIPTIVHEFNHSYINPVLDPQMPRFESAGARIYASSLTGNGRFGQKSTVGRAREAGIGGPLKWSDEGATQP